MCGETWTWPKPHGIHITNLERRNSGCCETFVGICLVLCTTQLYLEVSIEVFLPRSPYFMIYLLKASMLTLTTVSIPSISQICCILQGLICYHYIEALRNSTVQFKIPQVTIMPCLHMFAIITRMKNVQKFLPLTHH